MTNPPAPREQKVQAPAGGAAGASGKSGRGQNGPAAITVGQTQTGNINVYVDALGTVTPTYTTTIYSQITGKVLLRSLQAKGQIVRKGQPLVDIDPRPYEATLGQAKGTLQHDQGRSRPGTHRPGSATSAAYARNAIAQTAPSMTRNRPSSRIEGTVQTDDGHGRSTIEVQLSYCHITAPISGRDRSAPGRSRQHCLFGHGLDPRRHHPAPAHYRRLQHL